MINGLEGVPGSGKSYEAVVYHVLDALKRGRLVITNLPLVVESLASIDPSYRDLVELRTRPSLVLGTWDADRVDEQGRGSAFELVAADEYARGEATVFGNVWDYYSTWKHPVTGDGPLYVVDECHNALPDVGTSPAVVEWFKLHRHFNANVLLMTQSFRDVSQKIARLLHMLIKCRKADVLGRADHYIRKVHGGYRGAVISTEQRKYLPQMFQLYKSHTQGASIAEASAQDVAPMLVQFNRLKWVVVALGAVATAYAWWPASKPVKPAGIISSAQAAPVPVGPKVAPPPQPIPQGPAPAEIDAYPEPYGPKGLHITGRIVMAKREVFSFALSQGLQVVATLTDADLVKAGYKWQPLADCAGVLTFGTKKRTVICDAPSQGFLAANGTIASK